MSRPTPDIFELLEQVWEQEPTEKLRHQINELLDGDAQAQKRYLEYQLLHADLLDPSGPLSSMLQSSAAVQIEGPLEAREPAWMTGLVRESQAAGGQGEQRTTAGQVVSLLGYVMGRALASKRAYKAYAFAAMMLIAVVLFFVFDRGQTPSEQLALQGPAEQRQPDPHAEADPPAVAILTGQHDAAWNTPGVLTGNALRPGQRLTLTAGAAEMTTELGVVATLEAPCTVEFVDHTNRLHLHSGKLFVDVPARASGFTVMTPTAHAIDIGTQFGIEVDPESQSTHIQVHKGLVHAVPVEGNQPAGQMIELTDNQAVAINSEAGIRQASFDPARFEQGLSTASHRPLLAGDPARWMGQLTPNYPIHLKQSSEGLWVFAERAGLLLQEAIKVNLAEGNWEDRFAEEKPRLSAGTRVDVYLLHVHTLGQETPSGRYVLTFDRPVLGLITSGLLLWETDGPLGAPGFDYEKIATLPFASRRDQRGLDRLENRDDITVSEDRRTVVLSAVSLKYMDQVRILVQAGQADNTDAAGQQGTGLRRMPAEPVVPEHAFELQEDTPLPGSIGDEQAGAEPWQPNGIPLLTL